MNEITSSVATLNPEYEYNFPRWQQNTDATNGQDAVKTSTQALYYLPKLESQESDQQYGQKAYDQYKRYASFSDIPGITLNSFLGLINRKPTQIKLPDNIEYLLDDADLNGTPLTTLLRKIEREGLVNNRVGVLIDAPESDGTQRTIAQAERDNIRPYLSVYIAQSIIDWSEERINNKKQTTFVKLYEESYRRNPTDEFKIDLVKSIRVLDLIEGVYRQRLYEYVVSATTGTGGTTGGTALQKNTKVDAESYKLVSETFPMFNGANINYIPFYSITGEGITWDIQESILAPICRTAISEYRTDASYENALLLSGNPVSCFSGLELDRSEDGNGNIVVGSSAALHFSEGGKSWFHQPEQGFDALKQAKEAKRAQMAMQGARVLESGPNGVETEGTAEIRRMGTLSILASYVGSLNHSMNMVLRDFYELSGGDADSLDAEDLSIAINTDFTPSDVDPQKLNVLMGMLQSGVLSYQAFYNYLERNELFAPGRTIDEELEAIAEDAQKRVEEASVDLDQIEDENAPN